VWRPGVGCQPSAPPPPTPPSRHRLGDSARGPQRQEEREAGGASGTPHHRCTLRCGGLGQLTLQNHLFHPKGAYPHPHPTSFSLTGDTSCEPPKIIFFSNGANAHPGKIRKVESIKLPFPTYLESPTLPSTHAHGGQLETPTHPAHDAPRNSSTSQGSSIHILPEN
jgi:hypothetical protein